MQTVFLFAIPILSPFVFAGGFNVTALCIVVYFVCSWIMVDWVFWKVESVMVIFFSFLLLSVGGGI
jgi:hypothetical protein